MGPTAKSIFYYSFYMMGTGLGLFFIPNTILGLFGLAPTSDVWIRMLGLLSFCAGLLYFYCGRTNQTGFFRISVPERVVFFFGHRDIGFLYALSTGSGSDWQRGPLRRHLDRMGAATVGINCALADSSVNSELVIW